MNYFLNPKTMAHIQASETKQIRNKLKETFPKVKFSVTTRDHSSSHIHKKGTLPKEFESISKKLPAPNPELDVADIALLNDLVVAESKRTDRRKGDTTYFDLSEKLKKIHVNLIL